MKTVTFWKVPVLINHLSNFGSKLVELLTTSLSLRWLALYTARRMSGLLEQECVISAPQLPKKPVTCNFLAETVTPADFPLKSPIAWSRGRRRSAGFRVTPCDRGRSPAPVLITLLAPSIRPCAQQRWEKYTGASVGPVRLCSEFLCLHHEM